jgi:integrase/recombinase XerC
MPNITPFQNYLQSEKNYSPHTLNAYINDLKTFQNFIKNQFDQPEIETVNYQQIRSWIVALADANQSNTTINRKIQSLKAFYKFLQKTKQIKTNPLQTHKALKTPKTIQIPFSEKELNTVLNQITYPDGFNGIRDKLIIDLFYTTGIRRTELINLQTSNVNTANQTIKVLGKRNKERILPTLQIINQQIQLYKAERSKIQSITDNNHFFISQKGVKISETFVYRLINNYFSGVTEKVKKSPHILRHTFATHLLNNGADLNSVKELLGHTSLASTQIYTHSSLTELKKIYGNTHPREK